MSLVPEIIGGASVVVDAASLATMNKKSFSRFFNKFFRKKIKVIVYGDSGVGKTQFLKTLTGNNAYSTYAPLERTRQLQHYTLTLASGRRVLLIDTPGQKSNKVERDTALDEIVSGKITGIINLVDYGYQDSESVQTDPNSVFQNGTSIVKPEYLKNNRKLEIDRTKEFIERINPHARVNWILTVINKADVWDSEREAVFNYYNCGDYHNTLQELNHAAHLVLCPFCSVITPFGNKEMALTYSERNKRRDFDSLIMILEELIQKSHGE